ncbi:MAG: Gfo/Idh/MocA family oxidoreductase [Ignavibacteriales bacterium]|nr:Gfo/Idh/MocA family oxidoreductase [Ignavibacteriales bacterium]
MDKFPVGVIGVGHLGSLHAKMYNDIPSVELVGVVDVDIERAKRAAKEYKTKPYINIAALQRHVKGVSITTPTITHFEVAKQAIETGVHLFIEKPITHTTSEAETLVQMAKQSNVVMQVGHIERFNPALLALESYHLRPMFIESHRLAPFNPRGTDVAVVLDLMIHDIDIILSLVKSPVQKIDANGVAVVSDNVDIANARLQFESGCVANVTASRISQKKMRKMRLFQRDAYISIDFSDGTAEVFRLVDEDEKVENLAMMLGKIDAGTQKRKIVYERPKIKKLNALKHELELFINAARDNTQPVVTGEEGLQALRVANSIMEIINKQRISF